MDTGHRCPRGTPDWRLGKATDQPLVMSISRALVSDVEQSGFREARRGRGHRPRRRFLESESSIERRCTQIFLADTEVHPWHVLALQLLAQGSQECATQSSTLRLRQKVDVQVGWERLQIGATKRELRLGSTSEQPRLIGAFGTWAVSLHELGNPLAAPPVGEVCGVSDSDEVADGTVALVHHPRKAARVPEIRFQEDVGKETVI